MFGVEEPKSDLLLSWRSGVIPRQGLIRESNPPDQIGQVL
jgi:hypothetical protein